MKRLACFLSIGFCLGLAALTGLAATCGPVRIDRVGANVVVNWSGSCRLQATAQLEVPAWTDVPAAASPFVTPATGSRRFFRTTDGSNSSPNVVGYVKITVPAGSLAILANPLNGTNNALNTILPLPDSADGVSIHRFDTTTQSYRDTVQWIAGLGWFSASDPNPTIDPGEGFFFQNVAGIPLNLTFVGEVPQGNLVNPLPGPNQVSIRSSIAPLTLPLGDTATPGTLNFAAEDGDTVHIFDVATQDYKDTYQYLGGLGWFSTNPDDPGPQGPVIPVATGFFIQKSSTATSSSWTQAFNPAGGPCVPPTITVQPQPASQTVEACSCVTNTVVATGTAPLTYQWQRNGVNIPGATGASYIICPARLADSGSYRVVVGNACGNATSVSVTLSVTDKTPPVLHCPTNDIVVPGTPPGAVVPYTVTATDCDPSVTVNCAPASGAVFPCGTTTVTCHATDSSGNSSTCSFRVIVVCDCMAVLHERIQAVPGVPGKFNYSFDFYNFSAVTAKYLFVVPKTACLVANPDIVTFNPPVPPGGVTNVSVMLVLGAGCSTGLCLNVSAHDTNLVRCCSTMRCLPDGLKPMPKIALSGTNIIFCWPEVFPDYSVDCTTNLASPIIWTPSPLPQTVANGNICVTAPLTGRAKFFRLRQR